MSAFDELRCLYPLPVTEAQHQVFQTKDLDCYQENYTLREDGTLWKTHYDVEDRSDPNATGLLRLAGMATRVNQREEPEPYTGTVEFYSDYALPDRTLGRDGRGDVTFVATFADGRLTALDILEHHEPPAARAIQREETLDRTLSNPQRTRPKLRL